MVNKSKTMKNILFTISSIFLISCNSEDPFEKVKFGFEKEKTFVHEGIKNGRFSLLTTDKDSLLRYNIDGNPLVVYTNPSYYYKGKGALRAMTVSTGEDSVFTKYSKYKKVGRGQVLKEKVDNIYETYLDWYGEPDSLTEETVKEKAERKAKEMEALMSKSSPKSKSSSEDDLDDFVFDDPVYTDEELREQKKKAYEDSIRPPRRRAVWIRDNFTLVFNSEFPKRDSLFNGEYYYDSYEAPTIRYEMKDYDSRINWIKDSIANSLTPNDVVGFDVNKGKWASITDYFYDSKFQITISNIHRKDKEEKRHVKAFRFDIVIKDDFDEEIIRIEDYTHKCEKKLWSRREESMYIQDMSGWNYSISYNSRNYNDPLAMGLEKARKYSLQNDLKFSLDITSISYSDGTVLKSK